ncbi:MAG: hypothetical protein IPJ87_12410 [Flavobacteriales bacterium]|nr:hypothetical protein [Flavobacteriales bacterium]
MAGANHYSGGSITYQCLGGNQYLVNLDLFVDCSGVDPIPQNLTFQSDCGTTFTLNALPVPPGTEVSQLCPTSLPNSTCNGGALPGIEHYQFQTVVNLAACDDWTISWSICCRNTTVNLTGTPGMYLEAMLDNATAPCNNSPVFIDLSIPYVCRGQTVNYNYGVTEPDGHTIVYSLINARFAAPAPTSVPYAIGYNGGAPIPGITLDPTTGQLTFNAALQGNYVVAVLVQEFDANGNLIGSVMRDQMFVVMNCTGNAPTTGGLVNNTGGLLLGSNSIEVCDGEAFCVDVVFSDADPGTVLTLSSNATALLPGATFTITGTNPATGTLCWTGDINNTPVNVYVEARDGNCPIENVASTSINIISTQGGGPLPDAGTNGVLNLCTSSGNANLFASLGGTPDAGGTWQGPGGVPHSGTFVPGTDPPGIYTYTVGNSCVNATATVNVVVNAASNAGTNGNLTVCGNGAAVSLLAQLGGTPQAGGAWAGPSPVVGGTTHPATMAPGVYTYTVTGMAPCTNAQATVTVVENAATNAGTNGNLTVCGNGAAVSLLAQLGGTPQAGGAWAGPSPVVGGNYDPATMAPGVYTYTVTGVAPCTNAQATVTVVENAATNAGTNGNLTVCSDGAAVSLLAQLGGTPQAGGAWAGPSPVVGGNYDPATMAPGVYTYTVTGVAPCTNAQATVTVVENAATNAGTNGNLTVCGNGAAVSLLAQLGGTPQAGGAWAGPSPVVGGNYDPATMAPGVYTYTVTGVAPCTNAQATVTVVENADVDAGTDGAITVCDAGAAVGLFAQLGGTPDAGGSWTDPLGNAHSGSFDPGTDAAGVYTYTLAALAPCLGDQSTVTVTVTSTPDAGADGAITVCDQGAAVGLFAQLGGAPDAGGAWTDPLGNAHSGSFDPGTDAAGVYTYTLAALAPCLGDQSTVTVTVTSTPDAGTDGAITVCDAGAAVGLFAQLGGTPDAGGAWTDPLGNAHSGSFDPAADPAGVYTYTLAALAPCLGDQSTVTVTVTSTPDAGTDGAITVCDQGAAVGLFAQLGGTPDAGGSWTDPLGNAHSGSFDPGTDPAGVYTYTLAALAPCLGDQSTVTVTVTSTPDAGTDGAITVCDQGAAVGLFAQLGGTPDAGGAWTDPLGNAHSGSFDPAADPAGVYTYTLAALAPCLGDQSTVTVTVTSTPDAGTDGAITVCDAGAAVGLFAQLGGTPDAGGAWTDPLGNAHSGSFDPGTDAAGVYTYTLAALAPCLGDQSTVTVTVTSTPDAGTDGAITVCDQGAAVGLFAQLGGTPDAGGSWTDPLGNAHSGSFDPSTDAAGVYTYTLAALAPCLGDQSTVTVMVTSTPDAGTDGAITV